jgi:hypothetical protein
VYGIALVAILGIILLIRLVIVPAAKRSNAASTVSLYRQHLAAVATPFAVSEGETVIAKYICRDLGAVRAAVGSSQIADSYPASFPLAFSTSRRLVVLMSTSDRPSDITGSYPALPPNLNNRIGGQGEAAAGGPVSSAGWEWAAFEYIVMHGEEVALGWTDREGIGALLLTFLNPPDAQGFMRVAVELIVSARTASSITPALPSRLDAPDGSVTHSFEGALVICATCSTAIAADDRFCIGCGAPVSRLESV